MTDCGVIVSETWRIIVHSSGSFLVRLSYPNQSCTRPNRRMIVGKTSSGKSNDSIGTNKHVGSAPTISNLWSKSIRSIAFSKSAVNKTSERLRSPTSRKLQEGGTMCPDDGGSNKKVKIKIGCRASKKMVAMLQTPAKLCLIISRTLSSSL